MKNKWVLVVGVVVVIGLAVWFLRGGRVSAPELNLSSQLDTATKSPADREFKVVDLDVGGDTRKAITAHPPSRVTWKVRVPRNAWLRTAVAIQPEAWTKEGDGVLFFIGVSDERAYDELFKQHLNPISVPGDRRWIPVTLDLSAYAEQEVSIIFNTRTSLPGADDPRNDWAVWADPVLFAK